MEPNKSAILFIGGEGPRSELCKGLIKKGDLIIAADSGLLKAEDFGFKPDWIIGDMDSLEDLSRLSSYPKDIILQYPVDKDYTDTELALQLAWEKGCTDITMVGGGGGRTDHLLAITALFDRPRAPQRWFTETEMILAIENQLHLSVPKNTLFSLFPVGDGPWQAESTGLRWPLSGLQWRRGVFGLSNRTTQSFCEIRVYSGRFLALLPLEAFRTCPQGVAGT